MYVTIPPIDDMRRLLAHERQDIRNTLMRLLYGTGIRSMTALRMRVRHVNMEAMTIGVRSVRHGHVRVQVPESLRYSMYRLIQGKRGMDHVFDRNGKPLVIRTLQVFMRQACKALEIEPITPLTLQYCWIHFQLRRCVDPEKIRRITGRKTYHGIRKMDREMPDEERILYNPLDELSV